MAYLATLTVLAAAVAIALYSGSLLLCLAAICGACGVIVLMAVPAAEPVASSQRMASRRRIANQ